MKPLLLNSPVFLVKVVTKASEWSHMPIDSTCKYVRVFVVRHSIHDTPSIRHKFYNGGNAIAFPYSSHGGI